MRYLSPRVREETVRPRLQLGAVARPLNFTVRAYRCTAAHPHF
jgi:hypothetical protein